MTRWLSGIVVAVSCAVMMSCSNNTGSSGNKQLLGQYASTSKLSESMPAINFKALTYIKDDNGITYVAGGDKGISTSSNGVEWEWKESYGAANLLSINGIVSNQESGMAPGTTRLIAVGDKGIINTSTDGINWTEESSPVTSNLKGVAYCSGNYVAVGDGQTVTSQDGLNWKIMPFTGDTPLFLKTVACSKYLFGPKPSTNPIVIAQGNNGLFSVGTLNTWIFPYGNNGVIQNAGNTAYISSLQQFILVGSANNTGRVLSYVFSPNPSRTDISPPNVAPLSAVAYDQKNNILAAVGDGGVIVQSPDLGKTWTKHYLSSNSLRAIVANPDGGFTAVGDNGNTQQWGDNLPIFENIFTFSIVD